MQGLPASDQPGYSRLPPVRGNLPGPGDHVPGKRELMPWILCRECNGSREVPVDPEDPDGEQQECLACKDSSRPGHTYREYFT